MQCMCGINVVNNYNRAGVAIALHMHEVFERKFNLMHAIDVRQVDGLKLRGRIGQHEKVVTGRQTDFVARVKRCSELRRGVNAERRAVGESQTVAVFNANLGIKTWLQKMMGSD